LTQQGISSKALNFGNPENKKEKFQGQEFNEDFDLDYYEFKYRFHDPQIGRFIQIDPLADEYVYNSTYAFSENKVTGHIELEGLEAVDIRGLVEKGIRQTGTNVTDASVNKVMQSYDAGQVKGGIGATKMLKTAGIMALVVLQPEIGVPLAISDLTGVPVSPSPQAMSRSIIAAEVSAVDEGVNITVKAKPTWNANQMAQAESKAEALTNAETVVTKNPVARDANLRSKFVKSGGQVNSTQDVDHVVDLQLGGTNAGPLQALDKSVNRSLGKQIQLQTQNLPDNTRVNRVILQLPPKKP